MSERLRLLRSEAVARIHIDRAGKRNAFTLAMWRRLEALLGEAAGCRVLLIESADPTIFCAGADLDEFAAMREDHALRRENLDAMRAALAAIAAFPHPAIVAIGGPCIGAGLALAAAADLRVAAAGARFALPPARLGLLYPRGDIARLVRLIGPAETKRLAFTARGIDAVEAKRIGLVEVLCDEGGLAAAPEMLLEDILTNAPSSLAMLKRFIDDAAAGETDDDETTLDAFFEAWDGAEFDEGLAARRERRAPRF